MTAVVVVVVVVFVVVAVLPLVAAAASPACCSSGRLLLLLLFLLWSSRSLRRRRRLFSFSNSFANCSSVSWRIHSIMCDGVCRGVCAVVVMAALAVVAAALAALSLSFGMIVGYAAGYRSVDKWTRDGRSLTMALAGRIRDVCFEVPRPTEVEGWRSGSGDHAVLYQGTHCIQSETRKPDSSRECNHVDDRG
jgi:hypothetical protein